MRLTRRCLELLRLLKVARWLTTSQIHRRFFGQATRDAARKRLHKLTEAQYLVRSQQNHMTEALFTLGPEGRRVLEKQGGNGIKLERRPPKQLDHFLGINELRIAAEINPALTFFFACWELPALGWKYAVIPDAVFAIGKQQFAVEFDRGQEKVKFFVRTKSTTYCTGLAGFPLSALLVVTDRRARTKQLMNGIPGIGRTPLLFTTMDLIQEHGFWAPIWEQQSLFSKSPGSTTTLLAEAPLKLRN